MALPHTTLDLTSARRLLVAGDLHGHLDRLKDALEAIGYDAAASDQLVLLGDLLDRGPDVLEVDDWLIANPSVIHILGNHDDMLIASVGLAKMDERNNPHTLLTNGGDWLLDFAPGFERTSQGAGDLMAALITAEEEGSLYDRASLIDLRIVEFAKRMSESPVAMTVRTPRGRRVALTHADVPFPTWAETVDALMSDNAREAHQARIGCNWMRTLFNRMMRVRPYGSEALAQLDIGIPDVDHVFLGHSIVDEPVTAANLTWLDTGPHKGGPITVLDVDTWLDQMKIAAE